MKLRNKKTGELVEVFKIGLVWNKYGMPADIGQYKNLAELNEEWEDDVDKDVLSKEPLIKDEKIRKAVRAWAEALGLQEVYCASNGYEIYGGVDDYVIQFEGEPFPFADRNKIYSIAELCGEEEE